MANKIKVEKSNNPKDVQLTFPDSAVSKDIRNKGNANPESKENFKPKENIKSKDEQDKDARTELIDLGKSIVEDIQKGNNPKIELSVRGLSNVVYDKESKNIRVRG